MAAHDYGKFKALCLFPLPQAFHYAMAIEELSFFEGINANHRAWLHFHTQAFLTLPVSVRREAREWAHSNLEPSPVARHKLATQQARLKQIRDRRQK